MGALVIGSVLYFVIVLRVIRRRVNDKRRTIGQRTKDCDT